MCATYDQSERSTLVRWSQLPGATTTRVMNPSHTLARVAALAALALAASASTWTVAAGDTLWGIARATGTTVDELVAANDLGDPDLIRTGSRLVLPGSGTGDPAPVDGAPEDSQPADGAPEGSQAAPDDGVPQAPEAAPLPDDRGAAGPTTHRVRVGDTLFSIARVHGTTVAALARRNGITDPDRIRVGQDLQVADIAGGAGAPASSTEQVGSLLDRTAREIGVDASLVKAVAWQESRWRNHVTSSAGARGIMQVMPATGRWIAERLAGRPLDLGDPADNVLAGVLYLEHLQERTAGDERRVLASYYQGPNAVARHGISPAGHRYVDQVLGHRARFR